MLTSNDTSPDLSLLNISPTVSHTISLTYSNSNKNMIICNHSRVWVEISILHQQLSDISQKSSTCIITNSFMLFYILMSHHQMLCWNWLHSRCEFNRVGAWGHSRQNSLYLQHKLWWELTSTCSAEHASWPTSLFPLFMWGTSTVMMLFL